MTASPRLNFETFFSMCEKHRWSFDNDVAWSEIRTDLVTQQELETLRYAALTEGFTPTYIADLLQLYCDDAEMGAFLSIQYYEEYKHFHALRRYLQANGMPITDEELMARRSTRTSYRSKLIPLLKFGLSEIFTAIFYRNLGRATKEPVLRQLCEHIAGDEYRHLNFYTAQLEHYVQTQNISSDELLEALAQYQHQGLEAVEDWTNFWQRNGSAYTGMEPYVILQKTLSRLAGKPISVRSLVQTTTDRSLAATFH
jgi:rubrerythrin